jgi:soluble lytic murein transglycosylase-like protein
MQNDFQGINLNAALERIREINSLSFRVTGFPISFQTAVKGTFSNVLNDMQAKKLAFSPLVEQAAKENNIDPAIVHAVIEQESAYDSNAVSKSGALGLMQLMPGTAKQMGVKDSLNPEQNIRGGTKYLSSLLNHYHGNLTLALSAYNAGPNNVSKYGGVPPFRETQKYVKKIISKLS